jgi:1,4-alpha-glucan branching enzyme
VAQGAELYPARRRAGRLPLRAELHTRRAAAGVGAPVRRVLGLPGVVVLRADVPLRLPDEFRHLVDRLHQAGIGVIVDWVPAHFPKDAWALARFDGTPLYEHPTRAAASSPTGARWSSTSGAARSATSSSPTRSTGSRSSTSTGCASTRSRRCSTSTTRATRASGCPNEYGGRENLEAVQFLQEMNATVYRRVPAS